jgi:hypothetical protein
VDRDVSKGTRYNSRSDTEPAGETIGGFEYCVELTSGEPILRGNQMFLEKAKAKIKDALVVQETSYLEDCKRIQDILRETLGVLLSPPEADALWTEISEVFAASWLILPKEDKELFEIIENYIRD